MAELTGKTISELPSAATLTGAELIPVSQSGASKKETLQGICDFTASVIEEHGSNSNGEYIKFANGTLIQYGAIALTSPGSMSEVGSTGLFWATFTLTLPISFIDNNYSITATTRYSTGHPFACGSLPASASSATLAAYDFYARANNDGNRRFFWQAVGRWK